MKGLVTYIKEAKERQEVRIEIAGAKGADEVLDSIKSACNKAGIYSEKIDNGIKFALQGDDVEKYKSLQELLQNYESSIEDDGMAKKFNKNLNKLTNWINSSSNDDSKDDEENKKEEE